MNFWMQTYTGDAVFFNAPDPRHINIEDIAHALSNMCRFHGHCTKFYSVAEHLCRTYKLACLEVEEGIVPGVGQRGTDHPGDYITETDFVTQAFCHDFHEAYLGDVSRPLKIMHPEIFKPYEQTFDLAIAAKFGFTYPLHKRIKHYDNVMLATEKRDLMVVEPLPWAELPAPDLEIIKPLSPRRAKAWFMEIVKEELI